MFLLFKSNNCWFADVALDSMRSVYWNNILLHIIETTSPFSSWYRGHSSITMNSFFFGLLMAHMYLLLQGKFSKAFVFFLFYLFFSNFLCSLSFFFLSDVSWTYIIATSKDCISDVTKVVLFFVSIVICKGLFFFILTTICMCKNLYAYFAII